MRRVSSSPSASSAAFIPRSSSLAASACPGTRSGLVGGRVRVLDGTARVAETCRGGEVMGECREVLRSHALDRLSYTRDVCEPFDSGSADRPTCVARVRA